MPTASGNNVFMYVGSYTHKEAAGISVYRCNPAEGAFELVQQVTGLRNASFLTIDSKRQMLYAVSEVQETDGEPGGAVACYAIDRASGKLSERGERQFTRGSDPCYVSLSQAGAEPSLLAANYSGGSIARFPLTGPGGSIRPAAQVIRHEGASKATDRQLEPHPHSIVPDWNERYAIVPDLGRDKLVVYRIGSGSELEPHGETDTEKGAGPRHLAFLPALNRIYAINELNCTIAVYDYDTSEGRLAALQSIGTLPDDFDGTNTSADLHLSPDGRFLYGSNRGHDSIAVYAVNEADGLLALVEHVHTRGRTPRNFAVTPDGQYLLAANQESDDITVFRRREDDGKLEWTGHRIAVSEPVCIAMMTAAGA
ncbi:lactonase family protein [Paenibacillus doosanensis]|uniref:lactonase family protein n=1 Tax=Paenibacillus doosanensis TaxID=1229154 RepID=UPI0021805DE3|nr:lactonase family protein [Paenibacillus doosanensis]MCS7462606.1 lactonase family protein [Paenibacillus doosanensis]